MDDQELHDQAGTLSVADMKDWLEKEIRNSAKAHELRVKGATGFVTAYEQGKITAQQASQELMRHDMRWGEALYGATAGQGVSDDAILGAIDRGRKSAMVSHAARAARRVSCQDKDRSDL